MKYAEGTGRNVFRVHSIKMPRLSVVALKNSNYLGGITSCTLMLIMFLPVIYATLDELASNYLFKNIEFRFPAIFIGILIVILLVWNVKSSQMSPLKWTLNARCLRDPEFWLWTWLTFLLLTSLPLGGRTQIQNLSNYVIFALIIFLTRFPAPWMKQHLAKITLALVGLVSATSAITLLGYSAYSIWMDNRSFGIACVLIACLCFSGSFSLWVSVSLSLSLFAAAVISESRGALITIGVIIAAGTISISRKKGVVSLVAVPISALLVFSAFQIPVMAERNAIVGSQLVLDLAGADVYAATEAKTDSTNSISFNTSGRTMFWSEVYASWQTEPLFGLGAGSSQVVVESKYPGLGQPHSEYLRVLHDSGVIGFTLFLLFLGTLSLRMWRLRPEIEGGSLQNSGLLVVMASLFLGIFENYLVFPYIAWPAGVILGLAIHDGRTFRGGEPMKVPGTT